MRASNRVSREVTPIKIYLGLGSNMGDRHHNLERALQLLSHKIKLVLVSPIYDTAPVGNTRQKRFLNLVCEASTTLKPTGLLLFIKEIEAGMGRQPGPLNSPRPIDIDILFYGDRIVNTPELIVPHPRIAERAFVLVPLNDIAPDFVHPVTGKRIAQILLALNIDPDDVVRLENTRGELCMK
jgi:2-amino-4-hydroxy-6-hydroxymethyldihydropteridine diphosphokinase